MQLSERKINKKREFSGSKKNLTLKI